MICVNIVYAIDLVCILSILSEQRTTQEKTTKGKRKEKQEINAAGPRKENKENKEKINEKKKRKEKSAPKVYVQKKHSLGEKSKVKAGGHDCV